MSALSPVIVWLRNDLRLDDHEPLSRAASSGAPVLPVFCVDPRQFGQLPSGVPKTGAFRARFLIESLTRLREAYRAIGGELIVRVGTPETILPSLAQQIGALRVYFHEEVASEETMVEAEVEAALSAVGARADGYWGHTLYHPDDLPFDLHDLPGVFTQFRQRVERGATVRAPVDAPVKLSTPAIDPGALPTLASLGLSEPPSDSRVLFRASGGEVAARERLQHYVWNADRLRIYKDTRNGMLSVDDSTKLSPWLSMGCISPRRVWSEVQRYERERVSNDSTYWLVFELLWRDYFRLVLARHGDAIFSARGLQQLDVPWRTLNEGVARDHVARWTAGTTGFPLVDASMRELAASGFMSNRGRQNVVSFLTKNLRIDWRIGAEWFESLLVDYDVASNWGNWAYGAGVGNDARGFRYFNLHKQALDYDPHGDFVRHWLPELAQVAGSAVHRPELLSRDDQRRAGVTLGVQYPAPMVDLFTSAKDSEGRYPSAAQRRPPTGLRPGQGSRS